MPNYAKAGLLLLVLVALAAAGEPFATIALWLLAFIAVGVFVEWRNGTTLSWE